MGLLLILDCCGLLCKWLSKSIIFGLYTSVHHFIRLDPDNWRPFNFDDMFDKIVSDKTAEERDSQDFLFIDGAVNDVNACEV